MYRSDISATAAARHAASEPRTIEPAGIAHEVWLERQKGSGGSTMDSKARLILALLMSSIMVLMVTLLVTFLNLGLRSDFLVQWAKAYAIAWPVAATTAFVIMPGARRLTDRITARLDGKS
jgi:hypothetical protein